MLEERINLHSHTEFCDGRNTMQEMIEAARLKGFGVWGFTPHAPIGIESPCNMKEDDVPLYLSQIERLRVLYPDMKILLGMEVDYLDGARGPACKSVGGYGLDYVIGSVHFIPNQEGLFVDIDGSANRFRENLERHFGGDLDYVVRTFWRQTQAMIRHGGLDIVGHIDKIAQNASSVRPDIEDTEEYRQMAEETIEMAVEKKLAIEINTKHYEKYGRFYPNPRYWERIVRAGVSMPINTDAHDVGGIMGGYTEAHAMFRSL